MLYNNKNKVRILCLVLFLSLSLCSCKPSEIDIHMFADIEECQSIKTSKTENADLTIYDSPANDKYRKELEYEGWFGCMYTSDELTFELFAYEFYNSDIAMAYFKNITGKENDPNPTFLDSSGSRYFSRIVVAENKAYAVYCKKSQKNELVEFLNEWFSVNIEQLDRSVTSPALSRE